MRRLSFLDILDVPEYRLLVRFGGMALAASVVAGAGAWAWSSGTAETVWTGVAEAGRAVAVQGGAQAGIVLRQITVEGRERTAAADLVAAIDLPQGGPLLAFDPEAARERLESLPWVKLATVERRLPDRIHIALIERMPIALWQQEDGRYVLVDADGAIIPDDLTGFGTLPLIVGDGAPKAAADLFTMLAAEPAIAQRVKAAVRVSNRRWDLWLDSLGARGIEVRLPEKDAAKTLSKLATLDREQGLLARDLALLDMRLPDRLIVRVNARPDAKGGKKTPSGSGPRGLPLRGPAQDA